MRETVADALDDFGEAVLNGLAQPQKAIAARYFYDRRGSELFEEITRLPEYYPTRTETALLRAHAGDLARLAGYGRALVEFGAGSATKTPLLLTAIAAPAYVPIDISGEFLSRSAAALAQAHPTLRVFPVTGDFSGPLVLPRLNGALAGFFPRSTIGNFGHRAATDLLGSVELDSGSSPLERPSAEIPLMLKRSLTLAEARLKARELRQFSRAGRDPIVERDR